MHLGGRLRLLYCVVEVVRFSIATYAQDALDHLAFIWLGQHVLVWEIAIVRWVLRVFKSQFVVVVSQSGVHSCAGHAGPRHCFMLVLIL